MITRDDNEAARQRLVKLRRLTLSHDQKPLATDEIWINPQYVTSIVPAHLDGIWAELWVVGQAGYGTFKLIVQDRPENVAKVLNGGAL